MRYALIICLCVLFGCDGIEHGGSVVLRDSSDIRIIENRGPDRPLEWMTTTEFLLGGAESGPEAFFRLQPGFIDVDRDGNIHVLDMSNHRVVVFDSLGHFLRQVGQAGDGPGEFRFPTNIAVSPAGQRVFVLDAATARLTEFDADGGVIGMTEMRGALAAGMRHADHGLVLRLSDPPGPETRHDRLLLLADGDTTLVTSQPLPEWKMAFFPSCGIGLPGAGPVFASSISWTAGSDAIASSQGPQYEITLHARDGGRSSIRRDVAPPRATTELAIQSVTASGLAAGDRACDPAEMVQVRGTADFIPLVRGLALHPDGSLWVRRHVSFDVEVIDVFDSAGAYVGTLPEDFPWPVRAMPDGRLLAITKDEWDVERLRLFRISK